MMSQLLQNFVFLRLLLENMYEEEGIYVTKDCFNYTKEDLIPVGNLYGIDISWVAPCENVSSGIYEQRRSISARVSAQSDQGIRCPLTESLDTIKCINGEQMSG